MKTEHEDQGKQNVEIMINGKTFSVHRGHQAVEALKKAGGVPLAYELDQLVEGELKLLPDDGAVVIKGGEQFSSQPRTGQSS